MAYKATKAGMIAFTQQVAIQNAEFGIRANVILPSHSRESVPMSSAWRHTNCDRDVRFVYGAMSLGRARPIGPIVVCCSSAS